MTENITINRLTAMMIYDIVESILYEDYTEDGIKKSKEREIPFRLRYRLTRNEAPLKKEVDKLKDFKLYLTATYGQINEEGNNVIIPEENKEKYSNAMNKYLATEITISIMKTNVEDFDEIKEYIPNIDNNSLILFQSYMTDDMSLFDSININK